MAQKCQFFRLIGFGISAQESRLKYVGSTLRFKITDLLEVYSVVKDGEFAVDVAKVGLRIVQPLQP